MSLQLLLPPLVLLLLVAVFSSAFVSAKNQNRKNIHHQYHHLSSSNQWTDLYKFHSQNVGDGEPSGPFVTSTGFGVFGNGEYGAVTFNASNGHPIWFTQGALEVGSAIGSPIVVDGVVILTASSVVTSFDQVTGKQLCTWQTGDESGDTFSAPPVVYEKQSSILFGIQNVEGASTGRIVMLNPKTCKIIWQINTYQKLGVASPLTISAEFDYVYYCDYNSNLIGYKINGDSNLPPVNVVPNSCSASGGNGQMAERFGNVYTFGPKNVEILDIQMMNGQLIWKYTTDASKISPEFSNPNLFVKDTSSSLLFAATGDNNVLAFNLVSNSQQSLLNWSLYEVNTNLSATSFSVAPQLFTSNSSKYNQLAIIGDEWNFVLVVDPLTGKELWRTGDISSNEYATVSGSTFWNGTLYTMDGIGVLHASAPCAAFSSQDCPLACLAMKGRCGCMMADQVVCSNPFVARSCQWNAQEELCISR